MDTKKGIEILKDLKAVGLHSGRFSFGVKALRVPMTHTIEYRDTKRIVLLRGCRYYFDMRDNQMALVVF